MKKIILFFLLTGIFVCNTNAQQMPPKIKSFLDAYYTSEEFGTWHPLPGYCDKEWLMTGDFDGNGQTDYLARFLTDDVNKTKRLHLIAFYNRDGEYTPEPFFDALYDETLEFSSTSIIPKGETISLGLFEEGIGPTMVLRTDGVIQGVCETDESATYFYKNGAMVNASESAPADANMPEDVPQVIGSFDKDDQMPVVIQAYLDQYQSGWTVTGESPICGERRLFEKGDFNGDGKTDYVVYFAFKEDGQKPKQLLYAFINQDTFFEETLIAEDDDPDDLDMMSFGTIEKGTEVTLGFGEESSQSHKQNLKADAILRYKCETDASSTFIYENGKFKNILD